MTNPTVFISYSHDSPEHTDRVLKLSDKLRSEGIDCILDQYETSPKEGWPRWMDQNIRSADFVLMVCTETYFKRVMGEEEAGRGQGVKWEGNLIYQHIYVNDSENTRFIPVLFDDCQFKHIPTPVQGATHYRVETSDGYEDLYRRLTNQPRTEKSELGRLKELPQRERKPDFQNIKVSLAKLPVTGADLFGRKKRLEMLTETWQNPKINILSLVAWGGVGKSALVNKWLSELGESFGGAERVFGWSFYSQGAAEGRQVSADQFIVAALCWFGDPEMADSSASAWDKGERLAELIKEERTLLILDGLEPLQTPPPVETGVLKDPALKTLLRELARHNPGLVVISTRLAVTDLRDMHNHSVVEVDLENLSPESGAEYLEFLKVDGTETEREEAAKDFGGHALALTLLGSYLRVVHAGDIRLRDEIPKLTDERKQGAHARRVMESYEKWFVEKPELDILRLMGLFDRPAEAGAIEALRAEPPIDGLTEKLQKLSGANWQFALESLYETYLLAPPDPAEPKTLDCHPLLREHFGERLKAENPAAWREAHSRLYEFYKDSAKELPDTLEEMAPLFAAVAHGCQAGRHEEALRQVYYAQVLRTNEHYSWKQLGSFGSDLAALSSFFETLWHKPVSTIAEAGQRFILNQAGLYLHALSRLTEATQPMQAGLEMDIVGEDWKNAAKQASNLSELYLNSGDLRQALESARQSVELADHGGDEFDRIDNRTVLAYTLYSAGQLDEAETLFCEAEGILKEKQPEFSLLYSVRGFRYCDLLLRQGEFSEVQRRIAKLFEWRQPRDSPLDIALEALSLGRAHLMQEQEAKKPDYTQAAAHLEQAVTDLRQAGDQSYIPHGLLARAELRRVMKEYKRAQADLDEAFTIATRGGMRLFEADCHLEYARLYLAMGEKEQAREAWEKAKTMVAEIGYHRRDGEVEALEGALK